MNTFHNYIHPDLLEKYEFQNYGHALEILHDAFPNEWDELQKALSNFSISVEELLAAGGNETEIPKKFDQILYPLG